MDSKTSLRPKVNNVNVNDSFNLKPKKPEAYDGKKNYLTVSTWLYNVKQYLFLSQLNANHGAIADASKFAFASFYMTNSAAVQWYSVVTQGVVLDTWEQFNNAVMHDFVPVNHVKR